MVAFEEGLALADFAVLAIPLSPKTVHIINADSLKKMKPGAFLINVARGSLVDEEAVAEAIDEGRIGGYAADVFECEDWARPGHPASINPRLREAVMATVFTPHIGSAVHAVRQEIELYAARNIVAVLNGEKPLSAINNPLRFNSDAQPSTRQDLPDRS
jgi:phosphonate dehydrogenase